MLLLYALNTAIPLLIAGGFIFLRPCPSGDAAPSSMAHTALTAVLVVLATSWLQNENLTWAFQSQFFLAYWLPLLAFALLAHAQKTGRERSFWLAWLAGVASAGTMANGTLALPLLVIQALVLRLRKRYVGVLLLTTALVLGLYFHNYHTPGQYQAPEGFVPIIEHSQFMLLPYAGPLHATHWIDGVRYVLLFLGGPWYFLLQKAGLWPAMAAGALWLILAALAAWQVLRRHPVQPYPVALLALLAYLAAAALGAAHGRMVLGLEQALSSRDLTPQWMAWAALLLLGAHLWPRAAASRLALVVYAAIPLLLLPMQLQGAREVPEYFIGLRIPALAVQLGVRDFEQIKRMSYEGERTFALAEQARREGLAVFGEPDMPLALRYWSGDRLAASAPQAHCKGYVDSLEPLSGVPDVVRIRGWLYDPQSRQSPSLVLISGAGRDRGVALGGLWRSDVGQALHQRSAAMAGFGGYLQTSALAPGEPVTLTGWVGQRPVCALTLDLPK
jgi:hypothetical protein